MIDLVFISMTLVLAVFDLLGFRLLSVATPGDGKNIGM